MRRLLLLLVSACGMFGEARYVDPRPPTKPGPADVPTDGTTEGPLSLVARVKETSWRDQGRARSWND